MSITFAQIDTLTDTGGGELNELDSVEPFRNGTPMLFITGSTIFHMF